MNYAFYHIFLCQDGNVFGVFYISVCEHDYSEICGQIFVTFLGEVRLGTRNRNSQFVYKNIFLNFYLFVI